MIQHHNSALFIELLWGLDELRPGTFLVPQCLACSQRVQDVINSIIRSIVITVVVDVSEVGKPRQKNQFPLCNSQMELGIYTSKSEPSQYDQPLP